MRSDKPRAASAVTARKRRVTPWAMGSRAAKRSPFLADVDADALAVPVLHGRKDPDPTVLVGEDPRTVGAPEDIG